MKDNKFYINRFIDKDYSNSDYFIVTTQNVESLIEDIEEWFYRLADEDVETTLEDMKEEQVDSRLINYIEENIDKLILYSVYEFTVDVLDNLELLITNYEICKIRY